MAHPLLSDLCSICHSETPKYRCPRCRTQTCSLSCYKRHQQRAACSGKRDPAAYVKKNDLATPSGVDRDYNYLKGVERRIEDAGRTSSERGIGVEAQAAKRVVASRQPNSALAKYLEHNAITVEHAPVGMSRQRTNQTRTTKGGKIQWTVEWIDSDGEKHISSDCDEFGVLKDLYENIRKQKEKAERRRIEMQLQEQAKQRQGVKRKREQDPSSSQHLLDQTVIQQETEFLQSVRSDDAPAATTARIIDDPDVSSDPVQIVTESPPMQPTNETLAPATSQPPDQRPQSGSQSSPEQYFYLLNSTKVGGARVLIPLQADATLTESLRNQTVKEYPTIYVLTDRPEALDVGFVLETDHLKDTSRQNENQRDESSSTGNTAENRNGRQQAALGSEASLDPKSILAMLKRDIAL